MRRLRKPYLEKPFNAIKIEAIIIEPIVEVTHFGAQKAHLEHRAQHRCADELAHLLGLLHQITLALLAGQLRRALQSRLRLAHLLVQPLDHPQQDERVRVIGGQLRGRLDVAAGQIRAG